MQGCVVGSTTGQWSLSSLMRLCFPNLTANRIFMLCAFIAGCEREGRRETAQTWPPRFSSTSRDSTAERIYFHVFKASICRWLPKTERKWLTGLPETPRTGTQCHCAGQGKRNLTAGAYLWWGRTQPLACLSSMNSCAVFHRIMQLFCSQII